jgi:UDP-GlcNAc3NAcA epimerase
MHHCRMMRNLMSHCVKFSSPCSFPYICSPLQSMKILTVVGARPQFIKAAVVSRQLGKDKSFSEVIVHTGQHYDANMSDVFFSEMELPAPKHNLGVHADSNAEMVAQMIPKLMQVLREEKPGLVLVYGDTNSTLAGAMAAKYCKLKLAHVEAGMRSGKLQMAEEMNRVMTDRLSDFLFCASETAINNLVKEGFENFDCEMMFSGDVMYDAALYYGKKVDKISKIKEQVPLDEYVLATVHRAENVDDDVALKHIVDALNRINETVPVVLPLHPRTKSKLKECGLHLAFEPLEPVGYFDMIQLVKGSRLVITDSGGLQKEAFFFKKNCITLRKETEWTELVKHGFNILTGANTEKILEAFDDMMEKNYVFKMALYGNGHAGEKIVEFLKRKL